MINEFQSIYETLDSIVIFFYGSAKHPQTNADNIEEPQRLTERGEEHSEEEGE